MLRRVLVLLAVVAATTALAVPAGARPAAPGAGPSFRVTSPGTQFDLYHHAGDITITATVPNSIATWDARYRLSTYTTGLSGYHYPAEWQGMDYNPRVGYPPNTVGKGIYPGQTECVSVRARDSAGNVSGWSAEHCSSDPIDDRSFTTGGGWTHPASNISLSAAIARSYVTNAHLDLRNVHARQIALVVLTCRTCGGITIRLNNVKWRTINTYSPTTRYKVVMVQPKFSYRSTMVSLVNAVPGKKVFLDAMFVSPV